MRKMISVILAVLILAAALPFAAITASAANSGICGANGDNVQWSLDTATGVLSITGTGNMKNYTQNSRAPWNNAYIKSVVIADGVTSVGSFAFYGCSNISSVHIGNTVTFIGRESFSSCKSLRSIELPDSVVSIGDWAFYNCTAITQVNIPDSVTTIGTYAFDNLRNLKSIVIPDSVTSIGEAAFYSCVSLTDITIPKSVTSIGINCFSYCSSYLTIHGYVGSYAQTYANNNRIRFNGGDSIRVTTLPDKTVYGINEELDPTGIEVRLFYTDDYSDPVNGYELSLLDSSTLGEKEITVTFGEFTTTFPVYVTNVVSISINSYPAKRQYRQDEACDTTGLSLLAHYDDDSTRLIRSGFEVVGFDSSSVGEKTVTVSYERRTTTYTVQVVIPVVGISIGAFPEKLTYDVGEEFDPSGLVVYKNYEDEYTEQIENYTLSGFDSSAVGEKEITVSYGEYS